MVTYTEDASSELWWCNSHKRKATFIRERNDGKIEHCCDYKLGGIMIPCNCVNLTDILEIIDD